MYGQIYLFMSVRDWHRQGLMIGIDMHDQHLPTKKKKKKFFCESTSMVIALYERKKLFSCFHVVLEFPNHETCCCNGTGLLNASHANAHVSAFENDTHSSTI